MKRHSHHRMFLFIATLILSFVISPGVQRSFAQEAEPVPQVNSMITSYAEAFSLSYEEAERRLILQDEMDSLETKIREGEPFYAGSWMQHEPEFGLVVAFKSPDGKAIIQKYLEEIEWADLVMVQEAPFTDDELDEIYVIVKEAADKTEIPFESGPNYRTSTLDFFTPQPEELRMKLEAAETIQPYLKHINIVYQEALSVPLETNDSPALFWLEWFSRLINMFASEIAPPQPASPMAR